MTTIHIYHTNDIHSHLKTWARTREYLQTQRRIHEQQGEACFIFDLGDFIDRADLYTEATLGRENVHLLDEAGYDAVTIGNNEGITLSKEALAALYEQTEFDVILSNLKEQDDTQPVWASPYKIYTTHDKIKIGVIGATAPFYDYYGPLGWKVTNPIKNLQKTAKEISERTDIVICLSHLGLNSDEVLAGKIPNIDLIIGSHTHHVLKHGKKVEQALLTGGGKFGQYIGYSVIKYSAENHKIEKIETELIETSQLPHVEGETREFEALHNWGKEQLSVEVFHASRYYNLEWQHDSHLARFFAEALMDYAKADCAFFSAGIFLTPLKRGPVTAYDLHRMLPHPINACKIEMTGAQLKACLQKINEQNAEWSRMELKGLGFRGRILGKMLKYHCELKKDELYVHGMKKQDDARIQVVTLDMFTFGWFFPELKDMKKTYLLPHFLRDILAIYGYKYFGK